MAETWLINDYPNAVKQVPSGKTLTVTYNGVDIIDSAEVSGDVAVTYDNQTIVTVSDGTKTLKCNGKVMKSDVALGGKTLKCSGKRMVSDVVVKVGGGSVPMPSKGDLITMNLGAPTPEAGTANQYRVLSIDGNIAYVMAMFDANTSIEFGGNSTYKNSALDGYLNSTWYNSLSTTAKGAIQTESITQYQYSYNSSVYDVNTHASYAVYSTKSAKESGLSRNVYAMDIEDIEAYFGGTFSTADIWTMFWNTSSSPSNYTYPWLRSALADNYEFVWCVDSYNGHVSRGTAYGFKTARPAFTIDLSKIEWSAV